MISDSDFSLNKSVFPYFFISVYYIYDMKNFNLVSPKGNGSEYTIRFQDPIVISKDSQIVFKFAELERAGEVVLQEDQSITINISDADLLPQLNTTDGTSPNKPYNARTESSKVATISAGVYSYNELIVLLQDAMNTFAVDQLGICEGFGINTDSTNATKTDIGFGLGYGGAYTTTAQGQVSLATDFESNITKNLTIGEFKASGGVNGQVDSACMVKGAYIHRYFLDVNDPLPLQNEAQNMILLRGIKQSGSQNGHIQFGLYNKPVSSTLGVGASRLFAGGVGANINPCNSDGANGAPTTGNKFLRCFVGFRCAPNSGILEVYEGRNGSAPPISNELIRNWGNSTVEIDSVRVVHQARVSDLFSETQQPMFGFQLYQIPNEDNRSYYRLVAFSSNPMVDDDFGIKIIYDSRVFNRYLPSTLEIGSGMDYGQAPNAVDKALSQLPYQVVLAMSDNDDGWGVQYPRIANLQLQAIPVKYSLTFTQQLGEALNIPASSTATGNDFTFDNVLPNFSLPLNLSSSFLRFNSRYNLFHESNIANPWKRDSYSIFIDLPTDNYKNTSSKLNGGFRKSVLANLPAPFASNTLIEADNSNAKIVAVYEPFQPVKSDLKNNEISVNSFKITIVDMKTELLAKQLSSSVVNFTILCSDCADNQRKAGNSNYNM